LPSGSDRSGMAEGSPESQSVLLARALPEVDDLRNFMAEVERTLIIRTLKATNGAQAEAARRLGISRSDLGYKIAKYGISDSER